MRVLVASLLLAGHLSGCSERPPALVGGRLSEKQLDWYARKARVWVEREATRQRFVSVSIDDHFPVKTEVSADGASVIVTFTVREIPALLKTEFIYVEFDARSGEVIYSGEKTIIRESASMMGTRSNPQGGANGSQPFSSETNRTPAAAGSRRSP